MVKISAGSKPEQFQSTNSFVKRLATGVLILNLFVAGMVWFSLHHSKLNYAARAAVTTQNITQVLDENISGIFVKVVMDGYELFYELKKLKPELPIIISSGYGDAEVSSRLSIDDIAGLISKPYNPDQLREVLKRVVEGVEQ